MLKKCKCFDDVGIDQKRFSLLNFWVRCCWIQDFNTCQFSVHKWRKLYFLSRSPCSKENNQKIMSEIIFSIQEHKRHGNKTIKSHWFDQDTQAYLWKLVRKDNSIKFTIRKSLLHSQKWNGKKTRRLIREL